MKINKKPLFTICIPVFNSEDYIEAAIKDLQDQSFADYECILIDDKSPDDAIHIAEKLINNDDRFRVLKNVNNLGVSKSRNIGIENAKGEYIIFLDSDDRYDTDLLKSVYQEISKSKQSGVTIDVITWEIGGIDERGNRVGKIDFWREQEISYNRKPSSVYSPSDVKDKIFQININNMCAKCFRLEHIKSKNLHFDTRVSFGEDALFSYFAILLAESIKPVPDNKILYYYRRDQPQSAMHTINLNAQIEQQMNIILCMQNFLTKHGIFNVYKESFKKWASDGVGSVLSRAVSAHDKMDESTNRDIESIMNSRSWRLSKPIRIFGKYIRRLQSLLIKRSV